MTCDTSLNLSPKKSPNFFSTRRDAKIFKLLPMKTVTGGVLAAKPISLSKAATLLSSFVSSENGASQAVSAYLRRASTAFNELKSLHIDLKSSPVKETHLSSDVACEFYALDPDGGVSEVNYEESQKKMEKIDKCGDFMDNGVNNMKKKKKKKSKKNIEEDEFAVDGKLEEKLRGDDKVMEVETEKENGKKKRKGDKDMCSKEKKRKKKSKSKEISS